MKELSTNEINAVNGGLFGLPVGQFGTKLGTTIGSIVDAGCKAGGFTTDFKTAGTLLGTGIGAIFARDPIGATSGIGYGVTSIVENANSIKAQKGL
nr:hypothetical protein [uncultured Moellerella sp.]